MRPWLRWVPRWYLPALLGVAAIGDLALPWRTVGRVVATLSSVVVLVLLLRQTIATARRLRRAAKVGSVFRARLAEIALTLFAAGLLVTKGLLWLAPQTGEAGDRAYPQYAVAFLVVVSLRLAVAQMRFRHLLYRLDLAPSQTVAAGFGMTILGGGLLLSLPFSVTSLEGLNILDAMFTATSAVTVTGLAVYDPGTYLTAFGQGVLLVLIQIGGMGTMAATTSLVLLAGRRLQLKNATALQETMDVDTVGHVRSMLRTVLVTTFVVEAGGAVLLHLAWRDLPGAGGVFFSLFHAVSAFCNAGFSLFRDNLAPIVARPAANAVVALLIILGGLGFPVIRELLRRTRQQGRTLAGLTLHARLALGMTGVLLVAGTMGILVFDWSRSLAGHSLPVRVMAAAFQSVSARTAGFNTVDIAAMGAPTLLLVMALMFIGGSPGGTAGGIKTTTAATVFLTFRAVLRGCGRVEAFRRTVPVEQVEKAVALVGISAGLLLAGTLLLLAVEDGDPLRLAFEAVSAFATTGLSAGMTGKLGPAGKLIVMVLMFVGRIGPMTLVFAVAARDRRAQVEFPEEKIMLG